MKIKGNKLTADKGKILRRILDGQVSGNEVDLGYTYYLNSEKLEEPLLELPEHYEEVDEPVTEETVLRNEDTAQIEELPEGGEAVDYFEPQWVTLGDYRKLEEELRKIKKVLGLI